MSTYTFVAYKGTAKHTFTCPSCGKANRTRTFTAEQTVNPFHKNADGSVKTPSEVSRSAFAEARRARDCFATLPLCRTCEDALTYEQRRDLRDRRRIALETA